MPIAFSSIPDHRVLCARNMVTGPESPEWVGHLRRNLAAEWRLWTEPTLPTQSPRRFSLTEFCPALAVEISAKVFNVSAPVQIFAWR
jgi:hypothetical protein